MKNTGFYLLSNQKVLKRSLLFVSLSSALIGGGPSLWAAGSPVGFAGGDITVENTFSGNQLGVDEITDDREWTIQGQVMENVEPPMSLPGVNVIIKGTTMGTITDGNGYFSIKAKRGDILVFKYIGFKDYEYVVSRQISNLSVAMVADSEELDEVIVTGMSEEKRLNSVSAVSTLNVAANLTTKPITSISQSLQGGITGLNVSQSTGLPGADNAVIKIRGISSLNTNNDPLVLVDGIPMDMNNLDPNTIESMTVLKDAAAAAMYGARAANGVIVVKTKRGMPGKVNVSYNGYVGVQKATYLPKFVDGATFMEMTNIAQQNIVATRLIHKRLSMLLVTKQIRSSIRIWTGRIICLRTVSSKTTLSVYPAVVT